MENEIHSLISRLTFLESDSEREIICSLIKNCVEQKNASAGLDYIVISDYTKQRGYTNVQTNDALLRLTQAQVVPVVFVKTPIDGVLRQIGIYSLNTEIKNIVAEYLRQK